MTPVVNNQQSTVIMPMPIYTDSSSDRDSGYYKDLMNKYKINEQYSKTKADKQKNRQMYDYSRNQYKKKLHHEKVMLGVLIAVGIFTVIVLVVITLAVFN